MLYAFFWVINQRLWFICQRYGTLFHLHRRVGMKCEVVGMGATRVEATAPTPTTLFLLAQAIFRTKPFHIQYPTFSTSVPLHTYSPMKMEQTRCYETLAYKLQTLVNHPEESV
jgi:hypothetical protein